MSDSSQPPQKKISRRTFALVGAGLISFIPAAGILLERMTTAKAASSVQTQATYVPCTRVNCVSIPNQSCTVNGKKVPKWSCHDVYDTSRFCCTSCCFGYTACSQHC